jgi:hypothetical protein
MDRHSIESASTISSAPSTTGKSLQSSELRDLLQRVGQDSWGLHSTAWTITGGWLGLFGGLGFIYELWRVRSYGGLHYPLISYWAAIPLVPALIVFTACCGRLLTKRRSARLYATVIEYILRTDFTVRESPEEPDMYLLCAEPIPTYRRANGAPVYRGKAYDMLRSQGLDARVGIGFPRKALPHLRAAMMASGDPVLQDHVARLPH